MELLGRSESNTAQVPTRFSGTNLGDTFPRIKINERNRCEVGMTLHLLVFVFMYHETWERNQSMAAGDKRRYGSSMGFNRPMQGRDLVTGCEEWTLEGGSHQS